MSDTKKAETFHLAEMDAKTLVFEDKKSGRYVRRYLWGEGDTSDVTGPARLSGVIDEWGLGDGEWFIFYLEDCAFPPLYAVSQTCFEDAYEDFIDWHADNCHGLVIDEADLKDYPDGAPNYTSNGKPVDTECVMGFGVKLVEAKF